MRTTPQLPIIYGKYFLRSYKKQPARIKKLAEEKEILFRKNPFDPALKTHKLTGKLSDCYSFSINHSHRILFIIREDCIEFINIGTHSIYK